MAGISGFRLKLLRALGGMPSAGKIEGRRAAEKEVQERIDKYIASPEYVRYRELEAIEASGVFERMREKCRLDKTKYSDTEEGKCEVELKTIRKSFSYKWFVNQQKKGLVHSGVRNTINFFDDFTSARLNTSLWATRFFWGDAQLGKPYSFFSDQHAYTDGKNIRISDGKLVITTRPEEVEALAWDRQLGFLPKRFSYTSGLITTGNSFRLSKGVFEAKVRFSAQEGVFHSFYLVGDTRLPQIDVFRSTPGSSRFISGVYTVDEGMDTRASVGSLPFSSEFFILSVEISVEKILWKINGVTYFEETNSLPETPLYLVFASGVESGANPTGESFLEIDWVSCHGVA